VRSPGLNVCPTELYQTFKEEITPMLLKLFHEIKMEEMLPNSFY
jgi:hypothetical protein